MPSRIGSDRIGTDRIGSDWIGSDRIGSDRIGLDWIGWIGSDRVGSDRIVRVRAVWLDDDSTIILYAQIDAPAQEPKATCRGGLCPWSCWSYAVIVCTVVHLTITHWCCQQRLLYTSAHPREEFPPACLFFLSPPSPPHSHY